MNKKKIARKTRSATSSAPTTASTSVATEIQQRCLNVFKDALWTSPDDLDTVQEVKGHLYDRNFAQAFSRPEYLGAYALRWSASRALGYAAVFHDVTKHLVAEERSLKVLSLGAGGGAEVVALAAQTATSDTGPLKLVMHAVDIADWADALHRLEESLTTPPKLSQYASAAAKAKNQALLPPDALKSSFSNTDVLQWDGIKTQSMVKGVKLITIMFTLNELYASSLSKTQHLLDMLSEAVEENSLLLVVDSPGSYSTVSINGAERKYPMQWLLDLTLLGPDKDDEENAKWTKLISEESQWFRLPEGLQYPLDLENMRYQVHLYKRRGLAVS